jgi:HAD superfamily hydrolase (TIGR01549 family)
MRGAGLHMPRAGRRARKPRYVVLLDSGDTLVDEATEVKDVRGATLRAELIPGAAEMVRSLSERGYRIGLVADGFTDTFRNVFTQHGLLDLFSAMAISEEVGVCKPHPLIFRTALDAMGVKEPDYSRVVMVGNHIGRDIRGANGLGLVSVLLRWSPRRSKAPRDPSEVPAYTIDTPLELLDLMDRLEAEPV